MLFVGDADGTIHVFQIPSMSRVSQFNTSFNYLSSLAVSDDGQVLVAAGNRVAIYKRGSGNNWSHESDCPGGASARTARICPITGDLIFATAGSEKAVLRWNLMKECGELLVEPREVWRKEMPNGANAVGLAVSNDGAVIAIACWERVLLVNAKTGGDLGTIAIQTDSPTRKICSAGRINRIAAMSSRTLAIVSTDKMTDTESIKLSPEIDGTAIAMDENGKFVIVVHQVSVGAPAKVSVVELSRHRWSRPFVVDTTGVVDTVWVSESEFATCGAHGNIALWDVGTLEWDN